MRFGVEKPAWLATEFWQDGFEAWRQKLLPVRTGIVREQRLMEGGELLVPVLLVTGLTLAVMLSAMAVIFSAYEYRRLFNQHQVLVQQWDELQVEWGQYLIEQSVWSSHHRIESLAASEMNMVVPETETIEIVRHEQK